MNRIDFSGFFLIKFVGLYNEYLHIDQAFYSIAEVLVTLSLLLDHLDLLLLFVLFSFLLFLPTTLSEISKPKE